MKKEKLLVSFSGGRTSAKMLNWIYANWQDRYELLTIFSNTGKEDEETLKFVHECEKRWNVPIIWVEARHLSNEGDRFSKKGWSVRHDVVTYETASRNGEPFEEMISVLGIPTTNAPFCSDQLKRKPIESYLKSIGWKGFYKAIGIRVDEIDRVNPKFKELKILYPLVNEEPTTSQDSKDWFISQGFDLNVHPDSGNCDNCWKKNMNLLCRNAIRIPESFNWWRDMTTKYGDYMPRETKLKPPFNFFRGNLSSDDIIELSKKPKYQITEQAEKDRLNECHGSCEAF